MFLMPVSNTLLDRLHETTRFIQVLIGPRQTGKTTLARQILSQIDIPSHYASADEPVLRDRRNLPGRIPGFAGGSLARLKINDTETAFANSRGYRQLR